MSEKGGDFVMNITAKQTHSGQHRAYGDTFRVWEIQTDSTDEKEVLEYCFETLLRGRRVPERSEWKPNIMVGGAKFSDANYYFAGYYTLEKIPAGYKFTVCEPYTG
jgi:hypothetical protein